jgi:hypothetical protein
MNAYRYNSKNRSDRKFNNCENEKNPNAVRFYATNMNYADNYKFIYNEDGEVVYECDLEVAEIATDKLFDMANNFATLSTYKAFIGSQIGAQLRDYTEFMNNAKKASERKMWANQIAELSNRENELILGLIANEFQDLSDFEMQNLLVAELKSLGYNGYITKNEIALF